MQTYTASYRWTKEVLIHAMQQHNRTLLGPSVRLLVNIVVILLLALWLLAFAVLPDRTSLLRSAGFFPVACLFVLIWPTWGTALRIGLSFNNRTDADALMEWELSPDTVKVHTEKLSSSEFRWQILTKVVEVSDGFLLYPQPRMFHWLPFSAFEKPEAVEAVRQFAKANGVKYSVRK